MTKTIVCSVGTSAAKTVGKPSELLSWVKQQPEPSIENAAEKIFLTFRDILPEGENLKKDLSAEIHSLVRIGLAQSDRIVLLASSTDDGYSCALAVKKYLEYHWKDITVEVKKIEGLQVLNAEIFRTTGVVEFVRNLIHQVNLYGANNVILNPTGGYKALVPYTVLLGMLKGVKCQYIFEQSTTLLELPPLPVEFKKSQFETYKNLFEKIERDSAITQEEWERLVPYEERNWFESLVEFQNGEVTLSAVGFLFLGEIRTPSALTPFLSKRAIKDCFDNLALLDDCDPFRFLSRVSSNKNFLDNAKHHYDAGNGLHWLKPGNTTDRYLVSVEDWRLLVWRAIREDQEGPQYADKVKVNPDTERRKYSPFMRMEYVL